MSPGIELGTSRTEGRALTNCVTPCSVSLWLHQCGTFIVATVSSFTFRLGTMDVTTTKMLSIHIDALLPPTSAELDLPHSAQVAAILGVGLVYQGTAQRRMAEVLLSEIG